MISEVGVAGCRAPPDVERGKYRRLGGTKAKGLPVSGVLQPECIMCSEQSVMEEGSVPGRFGNL